VIDSRKKRLVPRDGLDPAHSGSLFEEKGRPPGKAHKGAASVKAQNRLTVNQLRELEEEKEKEVLRGWKRIRELWGRVINSNIEEGEGSDGKAAAEREWLFEAEKLVETFRETRNLFLTTRVRVDIPVCTVHLTIIVQNNPFRGMFPRGKRPRRGDGDAEADEDRMASRLHLDLGKAFQPSHMLESYSRESQNTTVSHENQKAQMVRPKRWTYSAGFYSMIG
jgi:general transcription factor 3C polypeptide 3 (transcription factor C subunit 4)